MQDRTLTADKWGENSVAARGSRESDKHDMGQSMTFNENTEVLLLHRLLKLTNRLMAPFSTHLSARHKISVNEFRLLMTIGALGRTASHEVAELTGVNAMSVSRAVATLERHGRVKVETDTGNRRRKWLTLSEEGERLYHIMRPQTETVAHYLFGRLEPSELDGFATIVERLIERLDARDEAGNSVFLERTKPADMADE